MSLGLKSMCSTCPTFQTPQNLKKHRKTQKMGLKTKMRIWIVHFRLTLYCRKISQLSKTQFLLCRFCQPGAAVSFMNMPESIFHCVEYLSRLAGSVIGAFPHHCDRPAFLLVHNSFLFTNPCGFPICFVHIRQHTGIISSNVMKHVSGQQSIPLCVSSSVLSNTT